jgi:hypothetical protein
MRCSNIERYQILHCTSYYKLAVTKPVFQSLFPRKFSIAVSRSIMPPLPQSEVKAKVLHAARDNGSGKEYSIREIGRAQYHLKYGHLTHDILGGACAQAYKFDVSLVDEGKIHVVSHIQCGGH